MRRSLSFVARGVSSLLAQERSAPLLVRSCMIGLILTGSRNNVRFVVFLPAPKPTRSDEVP